MIRINGVDYNASLAYPAEKLVATIVTESDFTTIFTNVSTATEVIIVNNNVVVASYACAFNGIEKLNNGYKVIFNRTPMTIAEIEAMERTIAQQGELIAAQATTLSEQGSAIANQGEAIDEHTETLDNNAVELDDILSAITELGDLIAELLGQNSEEEVE